MVSLKLSLVHISLLLFLTTRTFSRPAEDEESAEEHEDAKKINDEDVRGIIEDLEALVAKIPIENFEGDTMLHQVVDKLNEVTSYTAGGSGKKEPHIYERKSIDKGQKVIVLKPSEDKITVRLAKKTFVGLRSSGEGDTYFVFYIYIRDAKAEDEFAHKIGGEDKLVEYDAWENREDKLQKVNNGFGWSECSSSIFIPCKTNESTGFAPQRIDHRKNKTAAESKITKKAPKPEGSFHTEEGFDANENIDFFWDLEDDIQKARFFGAISNLLSGGLSAIPNLLTGVFGGITEGIGGLLSGVLGTGGQLVSGIVGGVSGAVSGVVGAASNLISGTLGSLLNMGGSLLGGGGSGGGGDLAGNFLGGITNMIGQGVNTIMGIGTGLLNTGIQLGTTVLQTGTNLVSGVIGSVVNVISGVFKMGMGLVNSLLSFGGLGGSNANANDVGLALGINLGGGRQMRPEDDYEVQQGLKRPESGGMGGLISLDIDLGLGGGEGEGGGAAPAGRSIVGIPSDSGTTGSTESPAEIEGRGLLTLKLAEILSTKMGEEFGKKLLKTGLVDHPGWKTMDEAGEPGNTFKHEDDAFVGFGACAYKKVTKKDFEGAKSADDLLTLLTTALRTQCVAKEQKFYQALLKDKFLKFNEDDKTFDVPPENKYLHMNKLAPKRRSDLARAFEMSLFSKAFKTELHAPNPHTAPKHSAISRRVYTLGEVVIAGIDIVGKEFKCHQIKILRSLLTSVKAAFSKLIQDYEATKDCEDCAEELTVNRNDQKYLMTLMEFILHGLAPVQKNSEDVKQALKTFNKTNADVVNNRVEAYLL